MTLTNISKEALKDIKKELDRELKSLEDDVLIKASNLLNKRLSVHNFHGIIGCHNNKYVDCVRMRFPNANDFIGRWLNGFNTIYNRQKNGLYPITEINQEIYIVLKDDLLRKYLLKFLERNYYRHIDARQRKKPNESLWDIWFGDQIVFGFLICPSWNGSGWRIDKSEIRYAPYSYWTIGHVMNTGFVCRDNSEAHTFTTHKDFFRFYSSIFKQLKRSKYEKGICDLYIDYLKTSKNIDEEPLLIPEFRYSGYEIRHKYRLDFTVLNQHTDEYVGFEISPVSSHMKVEGITSKTQKEVQGDLKAKWGKEMSKCREYYQKYDITVVTFTDDDLLDLESCFEIIKKELIARPPAPVSVTEALKIIDKL